MKTKILVASVLSATLGACGGGGSSSGSGLPGVTVVTPPGTAPIDPPASQVLVDYKAAALPLFVGSYSGPDCVKMTGVAGAFERGPATAKVGADGMVETNGVSKSLLQPTVSMNLSRELGANGPIGSKYLIAEEKDPNGLVVLLTETANSTDPSSNGALVTNNSLGVACQGPEVAVLKTKSIYAALAKVIDSPKRTAVCAKTSGSAFAALNVVYQVLDGQVRLDDEVYSLTTGLRSEMVMVPADGGMVYMSQSLSGKTLTLSTDKYGNPESVVTTNGQAGPNFSCQLKPKA